MHPYSTRGRTSAWYAVVLSRVEWIRRFRRRKTRVLFAFWPMFDMCWFHLRSVVIVTPRYLADGTVSRTMPLKVY